MTSWRCLTVSRDGHSSWRTIEALSEQQAVTQLLADGFTPLEIHSGAMGWRERLNQPVRLASGLRLAEQSLLLTQLAMLVRSGLPVDRSLDLLRDQSSRAGQRLLLNDALLHVRAGGSLAAAIERIGSFPPYVAGVLRSAEQSGKLSHALTSLALRLSAVAATRRALVTALTYPAAVLAATLLALLLVLSVVVPQFEPVFEGEEDRLPGLTQIVLDLSRMVTGHGGELLFMGLAFIACLVLFLRSDQGRSFIRRHHHHLPGAGLRDQYLAGQVTGVLATLIENRLPVVDALPLAAGAVASRRWRQYLEEAGQKVREGMRLSTALSRQGLLPTTAIRLIEVGERSGNLGETLMQASMVIAEGARARIDRVVSLANPIAITSLGGLVGLLVAGVMLGIFAIGDFAG